MNKPDGPIICHTCWDNGLRSAPCECVLAAIEVSNKRQYENRLFDTMKYAYKLKNLEAALRAHHKGIYEPCMVCGTQTEDPETKETPDDLQA